MALLKKKNVKEVVESEETSHGERPSQGNHHKEVKKRDNTSVSLLHGMYSDSLNVLVNATMSSLGIGADDEAPTALLKKDVQEVVVREVRGSFVERARRETTPLCLSCMVCTVDLLNELVNAKMSSLWFGAAEMSLSKIAEVYTSSATEEVTSGNDTNERPKRTL